jgi:hypothetical protein
MKNFLWSAFFVLVIFVVKSILATAVMNATGAKCLNGGNVCRSSELTWKD